MNKSVPYVDEVATQTNGVSIGVTKQQPENQDAAFCTTVSAKISDEKRRTPGLKLFDFLLYPVLTNIGVFAISVAATYLTTRGGDRNAAGKLIYGKTGEFFHKRGEWLVNKFKSMGMTHGQADMGKMVFFSFLDGSLLAPFVKMFEDRRGKIACYLDEKMGTKPEDASIYTDEPKQTWLSVLGGRFATAVIVVPTAVALDKTGLNEKLFNTPGKNVGEWLAKKPGIQKFFGKLDIQELSRIAFFEAFYTSVCTAGLYFSSRFLARLTDGKDKEKKDAESVPTLAIKSTHIPEVSSIPQEQSRVKLPETSEGITPLHYAPKPFTSYRKKYFDESARQGSLLGI